MDNDYIEVNEGVDNIQKRRNDCVDFDPVEFYFLRTAYHDMKKQMDKMRNTMTELSLLIAETNAKCSATDTMVMLMLEADMKETKNYDIRRRKKENDKVQT